MKTLTKTEEQIMHALWQTGSGFLKDVIDELPEPKPHSNTVATMLRILIDKGFVTYEVQGRNNLYRPLISKEEYGNSSLVQMVRDYFAGNPANLVSHFVHDNAISVEELEDLLATIKKAKK